jgi:DNA-binding NarL/FixJ family response regulator
MRMLLDADERLVVVGEATSAAEALALARRVDAQLALVDVEMPGVHGFDAVRRLLADRPGMHVVMVSSSRAGQYITLAREAGAVAFLPKRDLTASALLAALDGA